MTISFKDLPNLQHIQADTAVLSTSQLISSRPRGFYASYGKRVLDILLILLAAPFVVPLVLLLAVLVAFDGAGPFYCQFRVGRGREPFKLWKIRTMVHDADSKLKDHLDSNPEARAEWDRTQKLHDDPRVTPIGRLLRKSSLDELPQLWNVLIGDMTLVGPRPMMVDQHALYPGTAYYELRPGLTGPWQVSDRNRCSFADRAVFDTEYHKNMSLTLDLRLILKTFGVVLRCTGK